MIVLALETATRAGSHATWIDGGLQAAPGDPARTHGERLPLELVDALARTGHALIDVDLFAVVTGPGSFTGLRVGVAAMQGLALATGRPAIGIPTFDALARAWLDEHPGSTPPILVLCLDGQRDDVFFTMITPQPDPWPDDAIVHVEAAVGRPEEAAAECAQRAAGQPVTIVGNGATRYREAWLTAFPDATIADVTTPLAGAAAALAAARRGHAGPPHALRPVYIRRPDAVLARERARAARHAAPFPPGWTVSLATELDDLHAVELLQRDAFTNAWGAEALRWELANTDVARLYLLRTATGQLAAYCACWMVFDELHINSLAVAREWRRRGLARALLHVVLRDAAAAGAAGATLEVRDSNDAARALYEGLGFRVEAVRRDYYRDPREDALILWNRRL